MKEPLLTLSLLPQLSAKVPEPPYSLSPTSTYPFRRILLSILSVSIFTPMVLYTFASHILSAILSALGFIFISLSWTALLVIVLLAARWTFQGRPDIGEFSADVGNDIRSAVGNLQRRWVIWRTPKDDDDRRSFLDHDYHGKQFDTES